MIRAYLICPVRNVTTAQRKDMDAYIQRLELGSEYSFHYPHRDVDQTNDDGGVRICREHAEAMSNCDEIHVWLDNGKSLSEGQCFDLGMAYMLHNFHNIKPLKFILANGPLAETEYKSFTNLLRSLTMPKNNQLYRKTDYLTHLQKIANEDAQGLLVAQESYGDSWKKRGGVGAYMVAMRKVDRLENIMPKFGFDIFKAVETDPRSEGVLDDIRDLRRYLLLIEAEIRARGINPTHRDNNEQNQDTK